jgi:hypothetical protein
MRHGKICCVPNWLLVIANDEKPPKYAEFPNRIGSVKFAKSGLRVMAGFIIAFDGEKPAAR